MNSSIILGSFLICSAFVMTSGFSHERRLTIRGDKGEGGLDMADECVGLVNQATPYITYGWNSKLKVKINDLNRSGTRAD